jgi:HK97 gp10 family phage protein
MIEVKGIEQAKATINNIKNNVLRRAISKGSRAGCKILQAKAKQMAPKKTGALRQAIKVRALPRSRRYVGTQVTMKVYYGAFVNYGTKYITARRFLNKTTQDNKALAVKEALEIVVQELEKGK